MRRTGPAHRRQPMRVHSAPVLLPEAKDQLAGAGIHNPHVTADAERKLSG